MGIFRVISPFMEYLFYWEAFDIIIYQGEQITQQAGLYLHVNRGLRVEAGGHVHLQQPGLQVGVNQNIKAVQLETIISVGDEHLTSTVNGELHRDDALDDDVLNAGHQLGGVNVAGSEMFEEGTE